EGAGGVQGTQRGQPPGHWREGLPRRLTRGLGTVDHWHDATSAPTVLRGVRGTAARSGDCSVGAGRSLQRRRGTRVRGCPFVGEASGRGDPPAATERELVVPRVHGATVDPFGRQLGQLTG